MGKGYVDAVSYERCFSSCLLYPNKDWSFRCSLTWAFVAWVTKRRADLDADFLINGAAYGFRLLPDLTIVVATDPVI